MKPKINLLLIFLTVCSLVSYGQTRNYLLHTDSNVTRLKSQIKNNTDIKQAYEEQVKKTNEMLKRDKLGAADCQELGLVYRVTADKKYAEAIRKILLDYTSRPTWEGRDLLSRTPAWQGGLQTSHTCFYVALGFDCIYDYLTDKDRQQIAEGIVRVGITPLMNDWLNAGTSFHTFDTMGHNWWSACVYMAGFAALAVRNEIPQAQQWVLDISETITEWVEYTGSVLQNKPANFDATGGFYESINYAAYGVSQYLLFRYAFTNALPGVALPEVPQMEKMADFFIFNTYYVNEGKPMCVNFGDGGIHRTGNACVVLLWNLGYKKDRYAWYLNHTNKGIDKEGLEMDSPNGLILNPDLPALNENFTPDLPTSHLFADMGWASMRNSWANDATMVAVKSGLTWNHAHADAGSFIVFHNGKNLIIDSGNSSYGNPLYTSYYCQSEAHNVVMWNGKAQNPRDLYFGVPNRGSLHDLIEGVDFKYLLADATGPYSQILTRNYRHFIWVGDVILVIDDLQAFEPGQFEWLLHYNGTSKRSGTDLQIKEDDAELIVRPLFPETFPTGGLPHDFPEQMRLEERLGYADHKPEIRQSYWSISHFEKTDRTKFITAIILKNQINKKSPEVERFEGKNFLGVRITQNGKTNEIYLNLLADGRVKHRNSVIEMNGWQTDAYLLGVSFDENSDKNKSENINQLFVGHGSYVRRNSETLVHSLSKATSLFENLDSTPEVIFDGQPNVTLSVKVRNKVDSIKINSSFINGKYDNNSKLMKIMRRKSK